MKKKIKMVLNILIVILTIILIVTGVKIYKNYFKVKSDAHDNFISAVNKYSTKVNETDKKVNNNTDSKENQEINNSNSSGKNQEITSSSSSENSQEVTSISNPEKKQNSKNKEKQNNAIDDICVKNTVSSTKNPKVIDLDDFDNNETVGYIIAPTIGLKSAIVKGNVDDGLWQAMNLGVSIDPRGEVPGKIGNTVIAGHREFAFKQLEGIEKDTPVIINIAGNIYTYKVEETKIIQANDVDKVFFDDNHQRVVLYTCYPFTFNSEVTGRYVVYLTPINQVNIECSDIKDLES